MAETRANANRRIRQENIRDYLSNQKHLEHVEKILADVSDPAQEVDSEMLARYKVAIDAKLKLIDKYLPSLKAVEMTGEGGEDLIPKSIKVIYE
ncbi:MAG: hypothetical protein ACRBCS_03145 [Cellvibrionaceae bacterium]